LYHDGVISGTDNYRYFVKKQPKQVTSDPKEEIRKYGNGRRE